MDGTQKHQIIPRRYVPATDDGNTSPGARSTLNAIPLPYPSSSHGINTSLNQHQLLTPAHASRLPLRALGSSTIVKAATLYAKLPWLWETLVSHKRPNGSSGHPWNRQPGKTPRTCGVCDTWEHGLGLAHKSVQVDCGGCVWGHPSDLVGSRFAQLS